MKPDVPTFDLFSPRGLRGWGFGVVMHWARVMKVKCPSPWLSWWVGLSLGVASLSAQPTDWRRVSPVLGKGTLYDVTVDSSSRFWAVGHGGAVGVSDDGYRWRAVDSGSTVIFNRVYADESGILIGGEGGLILFSADGQTFSEVRSVDAESNAASAGFATNGAETLAVFSDGSVYRSEDRLTWTAVADGPSAPSLFLTRVIYGGGQYVVVGQKYSNSAVIFTSSDGKAWVEQPTNSLWQTNGSTRLGAVLYQGGRYIVAGNRLGVATSVDGQSWRALREPLISSDASHLAMAYSNGTYFSTPADGKVSRDGVTWAGWERDHNPPDYELIAMAHNGRNLVVTGWDGRIATRGPAGDWTSVSWSSTTYSQTIASGNGVSLLVNWGGDVEMSHDGESWRSASIAGHQVSSPSFAGERFFLRTTSGSGVLWSQDAESWTFTPSDYQGERVVFGDGIWFGMSRDRLYKSGDGLSWISSPLPRISGSHELAWGAGRLVLATSSLWSSEEGERWDEAVTPEPVDAQLVQFGADRFVALSRSGLQGWHSADGENWTPIEWSAAARLIDPEPGFSDLHFAEGIFVATAGSHVFYSSDGVTWSEQIAVLGPQNYGGFRLSYGHNRWMAAASGHIIWASSPTAANVSLSRETELLVSANAGGVAQLTVASVGTDLIYDWYSGWAGDTTTVLSRSDQPTLNVDVGTGGARYWVRVSDGESAVDSETYVVAVASAPAIDLAASRREARAGDLLMISANVSGAPYPLMQWYRGEAGDRTHAGLDVGEHISGLLVAG